MQGRETAGTLRLATGNSVCRDREGRVAIVDLNGRRCLSLNAADMDEWRALKAIAGRRPHDLAPAALLERIAEVSRGLGWRLTPEERDIIASVT